MGKSRESVRMSLKEPPPPYVEEERESTQLTPPVSPTFKNKRRSTWSFISGSSQKERLMVEDDTRGVLTAANLSAATLNARLHTSDLKFAKVTIQLMTPKLEEGHLSYLEGSGWGYTFHEDDMENPDYKKCALDKLLGFNAYAYRKRLGKVEEIVVGELERRGFGVRLLKICVSELAIGVKWIIEL